MKVASPDITKVLVAELKALRERHIQFHTRVKVANEAARARDEEARKQNTILTERIIELERELKHARESIEVCAVAPVLFHVSGPELIDHRLCVSSVNYSQLSGPNSTRLKPKSKHSRRSDLTLLCSKQSHQRLPESICWKAPSEEFST